MDLTKENLKQLLAKASSVGDKVLEFDEDKTFTDQGVDSLDILDYLLKLEESYNIAIPDEDMEKVNTYNKLFDYLKEKM